MFKINNWRIKMKGTLTISRPSYGDERKKISIQVKDSSSNVRFLDVEIDLDLFAAALTGLCDQECDIKVRKLDLVGKTVERSNIEFKLTECNFSNRKEVAKAECKLIVVDGWVLNDNFSSQNSFFQQGGNDWARARLIKWT